MKNTRLQIIIALVVIMVTALACGGSVSTAKISNAYLAFDGDENSETTSFAPNEAFYAIVEVQNAPDDTTLRAVWIAADVEGVDPDFVIDEASITTEGMDTFTFDLSNDGNWPPGDYKVDIYLNDKLDRTLEFEVN